MAGPTGLEPATFGVTGRRSNQLNYDPAERRIIRELPLLCHQAPEGGPRPKFTFSPGFVLEKTGLVLKCDESARAVLYFLLPCQA